MAESFRVTSVGVTPAEDRAKRMRFYFIAMTLRLACVASLFFLRGWWILLAAAGAVLLPYFAVMIGNASSNIDEDRPDQPSPRELTGSSEPVTEAPSETIIVVDSPLYRRSSHPATPSDQHTGNGVEDAGGRSAAEQLSDPPEEGAG